MRFLLYAHFRDGKDFFGNGKWGMFRIIILFAFLYGKWYTKENNALANRGIVMEELAMKTKKWLRVGCIIFIVFITSFIVYKAYIQEKTKQLVNAIERNDVQGVTEIASSCNACVNQCNSWFPRLSVLLDASVLYPLQIACENGDCEIVQVLIEHGADVNCVDPTIHSTPLIMTLHSTNDNRFDIAEILIENGADIIVNADDHGENVLSAATFLSPTPSDAEKEASLEMLQAILCEYIENDVSIKEISCNCYNIYFRASSNGNLDAVKYLLDQSLFAVDETASDGSTALMYAVKADKESVVQCLMERGANPYTMDDSENSAYDYAVKNDSQEIIRLLTSFSMR